MLRLFARGFTAIQGLLEKEGDVLMLFFENQQFNNNLRIMMRVSVMLETTKDMRGKCALYTFWWKLRKSATGR